MAVRAHIAFSQHVKRDEGNAPGDQNRHRVERDALAERLFDRLNMGVHPLPDVLALDPNEAGVRGAEDEIEPRRTVVFHTENAKRKLGDSQRKPLAKSRSEKRPTLSVESARNSLSQWPTRATAGANPRK